MNPYRLVILVKAKCMPLQIETYPHMMYKWIKSKVKYPADSNFTQRIIVTQILKLSEIFLEWENGTNCVNKS